MVRIQKSQKAVEKEARKAKVSELMIKRLSYRDIAAMLGVSDSTIAGDVRELRREWAKTHADAGELFTQAAMDLDKLQARTIEAMDRLAPEDQASFIGNLIRLMDQRNRLHGLYPKPGAGEDNDTPSGPFTLQIEVIQPGNQRLVENSDDDDFDNYGDNERG